MAPTVIDFAFWNPKPDPKALKAAGIRAVSRYISDSTSGKNITQGEYDNYLANDVSVVLNWENTSNDYTGGQARGLAYGQRARAMARALGHPDERPIIFSIDTSVPPSGLDTALAYITGCNQGAGNGQPQGCYGTKYVLEAMLDRHLIRVAWQPLPPSGWYGNGSQSLRAHMWQLGSHSFPQFPPANYDENQVAAFVLDYGQHPLPGLPPPALPKGPAVHRPHGEQL